MSKSSGVVFVLLETTYVLLFGSCVYVMHDCSLLATCGAPVSQFLLGLHRILVEKKKIQEHDYGAHAS
jgi:hypothetical protein